MANKCYWVNEHFIDLNRNQITHGEHIEPLQPKVLAVLSVLAEHAGEVVSQDALMSKIWGDSIVSPNTLQRCITLLRKVLDNDNNESSIIQTHSKQGYSLEANVRWEDSVQQQNNEKPNLNWTKKFLIACILILICVSVAQLLHPKLQLNFTKIAPITSSDEIESNTSYSPDGRYLVFHRRKNRCESHIWAKDMQTQLEYRLTANAKLYGWQEWSVDGNQLVFTITENCSLSSTEQALVEKRCWRVHTLDFAAALKSPQATRERLDCSNLYTENPQWLNDGNIVMLRHDQDKAKLIRYDARNGELSDFFSTDDYEIYGYDYSQRFKKVAVTGITTKGLHKLDILDNKGRHLSRATIQKPPTVSNFANFYPDFHPKKEILMVNPDNKPFMLTYDGIFHDVQLPAFSNVYQLAFHPSGAKLVGSQGLFDTDIALMQFNNAQNDQSTRMFNQLRLAYPSIARSTAREYEARFQPNGKLIAFISDRTGSEQLWLSENGQAKQLSRFPPGRTIRAYEWSPQGDKLALATFDVILIFDLGGQELLLPPKQRVKTIHHWIDANHLLLTTDRPKEALMIFNINENRLTETGIEKVIWAKQLSNDEIVFVDRNEMLWMQKGLMSKPEQLSALNNRGYALQNRKIYGFDETRQLFAYDIDSKTISIIQTLDEQVSRLNDIKGDQALLKQIISGRKEIVEITP